MSIMELNARVNELYNIWDNFKSINDEKLQNNARGKTDPLYDQQLSRIGSELDQNRNRIANIEVMLARPNRENSMEVKSDGHAFAFKEYIRKGITNNLENYEKKALSSTSDNDGGYLVTSNISKKLTQAITEISPMRQLADIETISSECLDIIEDYEDLKSGGWTSDQTIYNETETPKFHNKKIYTHELYAQPKATQKLIDDANIDIEKWLGDKLLQSFAEMENNAFIKGDGINKPFGILSYSDGKEWKKIEQVKASSTELSADIIFNLYFSLKEFYANKASFLMHKSTVQKIRMFKDKNNQYIWAPGFDKANPSTILGLPVKYAVDMPTIEEGGSIIALADFKSAYKIVDRVGIRTLRDPFTDKPFVKFYTTKRVGGDVINFEAIKLLNI